MKRILGLIVASLLAFGFPAQAQQLGGSGVSNPITITQGGGVFPGATTTVTANTLSATTITVATASGSWTNTNIGAVLTFIPTFSGGAGKTNIGPTTIAVDGQTALNVVKRNTGTSGVPYGLSQAIGGELFTGQQYEAVLTTNPSGGNPLIELIGFVHGAVEEQSGSYVAKPGDGNGDTYIFTGSGPTLTLPFSTTVPTTWQIQALADLTGGSLSIVSGTATATATPTTGSASIALSAYSGATTFAAGQLVTFATSPCTGGSVNIITGTTYWVSTTGLSSSAFQLASSYANAIAGTPVITPTGGTCTAQTATVADNFNDGNGIATLAAGSYSPIYTNGAGNFYVPWTGAFVNTGVSGTLAYYSGANQVNDYPYGTVNGGVLSVYAFQSGGSVPTLALAGGTCAGTVIAGGASAGTVTLTGICAATNTMALTVMPTVTHGYSCFASDRTTQTALLVQTATSTTSATFTFQGTTGATDVIQYACTGY